MKKALYFFFFVIPFLPVFAFLKTETINYSAYYAIILLVYTVFYVLIKWKVKLDSNLLFWLWYLFITVISWPISFIFKNYGYLTFPSTAFSLYVLLKYYSNEFDYKIFIQFFIAAAILQAILGISQSFFGFPMFENITMMVYESDRNYLAYIFPSFSQIVRQGTGTYEQFNGLASYLALAVPISYGIWKTKPTKLKYIILAIITLGLITTFSRGSLIGTILGIYFILFIKAKKKNIFIIVTVITAVMLVILLSSAVMSYYQSTENFSIREYTWIFAFQEAMNQPIKLIYGFGPFYFHEKVLGMAGTITNLHSGQLQIFLEEGAIGFLLFMLLFIRAIKRAFRYKDNIAIVSITGGLIAFFVSQLFDNAYFGNTGILWFSFLAIVFSIGEDNVFALKLNNKK